MTLSGIAYKCSAGDTFDRIALTVYGDEKYACELLSANPKLCTIPVFQGGEVLELPIVGVPEQDESAVYMPETAPWKG